MVRRPDKYSDKQIDHNPQQPAAHNIEYIMAAERYIGKTRRKDADADGADDSRFESVVDDDEAGGEGEQSGATARKAVAFQRIRGIGGGGVASRSMSRFLSLDVYWSTDNDWTFALGVRRRVTWCLS